MLTGQEAPRTRDASPGTAHPWLAMIPLMIPVFMVNVDLTAVNLALAHISQDLDLPLTVVQWVANGYMMTAGTFLILGGRLGDVWGKRRMLVCGILVFVAGSLGAGLSTAGWMLIASRMFQGIGFLVMPLALSLAHDLFPESRKSLAMGVISAVTGLSISIGPTLGGAIIHVLNWHWVFWINLPLSMLAVFTTFLFLPRTPGRPVAKLDVGGQVLLALGLFALTGGVNTLAGWRGETWAMLGLSGFGLLFLILFVFHEQRTSHPLMDRELITNRPFIIANAARLAMQWSYMGFLFLMCLLLQNILYFSAVRSGILLLWITLTMAILSPVSGALMDRVGVKTPLCVAFVIAAAAYGGISLLGIPPRQDILVVCFLAIGVAYSVLMPGCNEAALGAVPGEKSGIASGMLYTLVFAGSSLSVATCGVVLHMRARHQVEEALARLGVVLTDPQLECLERAATGVERGLSQCVPAWRLSIRFCPIWCWPASSPV